MTNRTNSPSGPWAASGVVLTALALTGCGALLTPTYRMHRAEREMSDGQWQRAAVDLRAVVQKQPRNAQAWLLLARLGLAAGDPTGASASLEHAIASGARGADVNLLQARVWLVTGKAKTLLAALAEHKLQLAEPQRTLLKAKALIATGQTDAAIALLKPVLSAHANAPEARDLYAEALVQQGKLDEAQQQLATAVRLDPKAPEPRVLEGRIDEWQGQFAPAEHHLSAALKRMARAEPVLHRVTALIALTESRLALGEIDAAAHSQASLAAIEPSAPETLLLSARIKLARRDLNGGINLLERVVADTPTFVQARMLLGAALLQRGDLEQAQEQLQDVVQRTPDNLEARKLLAQVQLKLGEPQGALAVLTPALSAPTLDPQLLSLYGAAAQRTGNAQALAQALEGVVRAHPKDEAAKLNLAEVYLGSGQAAQALALLQQTHDSTDIRRDRMLIDAVGAVHGVGAAGAEVARLVGEHPKNAAVLNLAAAFDVQQGKPQAARALLARALAANPNDVGSLIDLAGIEQAMGQPQAAIQRLQAVLSAHPQALPVRLALADVYFRERNFQQARAVLEAAGAHPPAAISFGLAHVALAQNDLKAADAALDAAVATQPKNAALEENAGGMLMQANQFSAALARFAKAAQLEPDNARFWFNTARAQLALNQPLAARASLEKAAHAQPHWLPAESALALLDVHDGKGQAALARADALLKAQPQNPGVLALKGTVEAKLGQTAAAVQDLTAAQRLRPSALLAVQLYQVELAAHAAHPEQPLTQWLAREPKDWDVRTVLGDYDLTVRKALPQAIGEYQQVIAGAPNNVVALNNLAWALGHLGRPQALGYAQRAYKLAPEAPSVADTLGWILVKRGQSLKALPYLEHATQLAPHDPDMAYHYAYALAKAGQAAKARTVLTQALAGTTVFASRQAAEQLLASLEHRGA
ncbi:MAG: XrtA/PEP-CTERM system TPR-repeat protein PrsT [Steroidobacteraceae bacterium]